MAKFVPDVTVTLRMNPDKGTQTLVAIADMTSPERVAEYRALFGKEPGRNSFEETFREVHRLASDALEVIRQPESDLSGKLQDEFRKVGEAFRALGKAVGVTSPSKVSGEEILRVVEEMRPGRIMTFPAGTTIPPVTGRLADVEADCLKIKIGTLEIESGRTAFGATILADGKKFPMPVQAMNLAFDWRGGGLWRIDVGFMPQPKQESSRGHGAATESPEDVKPDKIL
jgi:hypothetical protein